jgi:hypothetical protein
LRIFNYCSRLHAKQMLSRQWQFRFSLYFYFCTNEIFPFLGTTFHVNPRVATEATPTVEKENISADFPLSYFRLDVQLHPEVRLVFFFGYLWKISRVRNACLSNWIELRAALSWFLTSWARRVKWVKDEIIKSWNPSKTIRRAHCEMPQRRRQTLTVS